MDWLHDLGVSNMKITCDHCNKPIVAGDRYVEMKVNNVIFGEIERLRYCSHACQATSIELFEPVRTQREDDFEI